MNSNASRGPPTEDDVEEDLFTDEALWIIDRTLDDELPKLRAQLDSSIQSCDIKMADNLKSTRKMGVELVQDPSRKFELRPKMDTAEAKFWDFVGQIETLKSARELVDSSHDYLNDSWSVQLLREDRVVDIVNGLLTALPTYTKKWMPHRDYRGVQHSLKELERTLKGTSVSDTKDSLGMEQLAITAASCSFLSIEDC